MKRGSLKLDPRGRLIVVDYNGNVLKEVSPGDYVTALIGYSYTNTLMKVYTRILWKKKVGYYFEDLPGTVVLGSTVKVL